MNRAVDSRLPLAVAAVVLVAALLGGQAMTDAGPPATDRTGAALPVGRAGFAYITGLRRFAAVLLFTRLEPQYHEYYIDIPADKLEFLMPSFYLISWLDPEFDQPYYMATWILFKNDREDEAFALARESVAANPRSGLLHASYAQMLRLADRDVAEQVRQSDAAMRSDIVWKTSNEQWECMTIVADIYSHAGLPEKADRAKAIADRIVEGLGGSVGFPEPELGSGFE